MRCGVGVWFRAPKSVSIMILHSDKMASALVMKIVYQVREFNTPNRQILNGSDNSTSHFGLLGFQTVSICLAF
jgi:hypothetical protein